MTSTDKKTKIQIEIKFKVDQIKENIDTVIDCNVDIHSRLTSLLEAVLTASSVPILIIRDITEKPDKPKFSFKLENSSYALSKEDRRFLVQLLIQMSRRNT